MVKTSAQFPKIQLFDSYDIFLREYPHPSDNVRYESITMEVHFRLIKVPSYMKHILCNGSRTKCSPMRSVMVRVITFVDHEYDYRPNKTTPSNHKNYNFREE